MNVKPHIQAGGTLNPPQHLYVDRKEDETFIQLLLERQYVTVLGSRQTGKSSLMMRAVQRLNELGVHWITVDLASELGSPSDQDSYYVGLLAKIARTLAPKLDLNEWWRARETETINQKLLQFFRIVGGSISDPLVIFLDEIDSTLKLPYADDLFTALRGMYNERPVVPEYRLITFCLLGVATPGELVKSPRTTAYNVGTNLELRDFDKAVDDLSPLAAALNPDAEIGSRLLDRVLFWSGGQPYLTQKLCAGIVKMRIGDVGGLDQFARQTFNTIGQAGNDVHFQQITRFVEERPATAAATLDLYERVLQAKRIPDDVTPAHAELRLSGLVKPDGGGNLVVRNPIYRHLFGAAWIDNIRSRRSFSTTWRYAMAAALAGAVLAGGAWLYYAAVARPAQPHLAMLAGLAAGDDQMAHGDFAAALQSYRASAAVIDQMAKADPGNAGWQHDLSVTYTKIGDVLRAQSNLPEALNAFRDGLATARRLAQGNPGNSVWQRDLSESYDNIGDVLMAQGQLPEALQAYRDGLAIARRLVQADPGDPGRQRDLSVFYNKAGDVLAIQGNQSEALKSFQDGFAIREHLAQANPADTNAQRDLVLSCVKIAQADPGQARTLLTRASEILQHLQEKGQLAPRDASMPADIARRIEALPKTD